jgi:EAL domain-containing protein (putative c-di-GMP-specific phosphodiesterase class I)
MKKEFISTVNQYHLFVQLDEWQIEKECTYLITNITFTSEIDNFKMIVEYELA